jgi:hypothetical protein
MGSIDTTDYRTIASPSAETTASARLVRRLALA